MISSLARRLWQTLEPINAMVYFNGEVREAYAAAGLKGGWMGYFASRSAPMGPVCAGTVVATFYVFSPRLVERAIPDAWQLSTPERVLEARAGLAGRAVGAAFGDVLTPEAVASVTAALRRCAEAADVGGRPLFAGHAGLPWPEEPMAALWHGAALLREHRFDGHVAMLLGYGLDPVMSLLSGVDAGGTFDEATQVEQSRGWSTEERLAAGERMRERGLRDAEGRPTEAGHRIRAAVEERTDDVAARFVAPLGEEGVRDLLRTLEPVRARIATTMPYPNPMGLKPPPPPD